MHPAALGDVYLHDGISHMLTVETRAVVTDDRHLRYGDGSKGHGQWWWASEVPSEVQIESHDEPQTKEQHHGR